MEEALKRINNVLSDANQKYLNETLRNVRNASQQFEGLTKETGEFIKDSRTTVKQLNETLKRADLDIDLVRHRASRDGHKLDLTPKEFALLALLARRAGEVLSRTAIAEQVWDMNFDGGTNVVDVHVRRLRLKVDEPFDTKLIRTVRGMGYVLDDAR